MLLRSPPSLHYPITVTELFKQPGETVERSAAIFAYSYQSTVTEGNKYGEEEQVQRSFFSNFEIDSDGTITKWLVQAKQIIIGPNVPLCEIDEACRHEIQYGGMCTNCGKDMTDVDYNTSVPNTSRADTTLSHVNAALKISKEEAARVDESVKRRLLNGKRLSLVVDLDLTIIQATVDPTIGEWQRDESNPNYEFVKNVRSFELFDESLRRDVSYYVKLRPGLGGFLQRISKLYELHIYTMGTRAYAQKIAHIVDPDSKLFGDRILSRTETPGEEVKNLRKLFPVDTRMVVIIDDRADVWRWSNYLVRVTPYDFFKGIGDINSSFLPKKEELTAKQVKAAAVAAPEVNLNSTQNDKDELPTMPNGDQQADGLGEPETLNGDESTLEHMVSMRESNDTQDTQQTEQDEALTAQLMDRPLLRQQKLLEEAEGEDMDNLDTETITTEGERSNSPKLRHHLLKDDDTELERIEMELTNIHNRFYALYERNLAGSSGGRVAELKGSKGIKRSPDEALLVVPDVKDVMKPSNVEPLKDAHLVFSGIVPLGTNVHESHFARMATRLGATISTSIDKQTTHVVARPGDPTSKMRVAARNPGIKIVSSDWLFDSHVSWNQKLDESPYIISVTASQPEDDNEEEKSEAELEAEMNGTSGPGLTIDVNKADEANDDDEFDLSPVDNCNQEDWDDMRAEIDDLSDDPDDPDDATSDNESNASSLVNSEDDADGLNDDKNTDVSDASKSDTSSPRKKQLQNKKRKRSDDVDPVSLRNGFPSTRDANQGLGSNLQRRKRQALGRSSSLTNMAFISGTPTPEPADSLTSTTQPGVTADLSHSTANTPAHGEAETLDAEEEQDDEDDDDDDVSEDEEEATRRLLEAMEEHAEEDSDPEAQDEDG